MQIRKYFILTYFIMLFLLMGGCNDNFVAQNNVPQTNNDSSTNDIPEINNPDLPDLPDIPEYDPDTEEGLLNAHFDVDTFFMLDSNDKLVHVHEYDDKYKTNGVIFFGTSNGSKDADKVMIPKKILDDLGTFKIKILNAHLNQAGAVYVNGNAFGYERALDSSMEFTSDSLNDLRIVFNLKSVSIDHGIRGTEPSKVKHDEIFTDNAGHSNRRDGALTIQLIPTGRNNKADIECSVYWHTDSH